MSSPSDTAAEIVTLEARRYQAMLDRDLETLEPLLSDDLILIHSNTDRDDKTRFLNTIRDGDLVYNDIRREDTEIKVAGETAVVYGHNVMDIVLGGKDVILDNIMLAVWTREGGRWKLLSVQSTPVKK